MNCLKRVVAAGAILAAGFAGTARAEGVFDQIPSNVAGVLEVKDLQGVSNKVAKFAKSLGLDQMQPGFADPLGTVQDQFELREGINKSGDMAIAFFKPEKGKEEAGGPPPMIVLIPTDDYAAFLKNFKDVSEDGEGISKVTVQKNNETLYIVKRGHYAEAAMEKKLLKEAEHGLKLEGAAAKEVQTRDAILYVNMAELRPEMEKGIKEVRKTMDQQLKDPNAAKNNPFAATMTPQMMKMMQMYFDAGEQIVKDSRSAVFSLNLSETSVSLAALDEFEPESTLGKITAMIKNTDEPLLAGLPEATYFAFGGAQLTPEATVKLFDQFLEPVVKAMMEGSGQDTAKMIDAAKDSLGATKKIALGYMATNGGPNDGLISVVSVVHGDAQKIQDNQKSTMAAMNGFSGFSGGKMSFDIKKGEPKTVSGVDLQTFTTNIKFDDNDPQAAQAKEIISMMYGRNGMSGAYGKVNDETFVSVVSGKEQLLKDVIDAAKGDDDVLDKMAAVKKVSVDLPKHRAGEMYVALDNIANAVMKALKQQGVPVQFKLPPNLPPIGMAISTEDSTARGEMVIPDQLIQAITAAGMQAVMQGGNGQGGGI